MAAVVLGPLEDGRGTWGTFFSEAAPIPAGTSLGSVTLKTQVHQG